jgi:hypothetical protein
MSDWEGKGYRPIKGPAVGLLLNRWMNIECLGAFTSLSGTEYWVHIPLDLVSHLSPAYANTDFCKIVPYLRIDT